MLFMYMEFCEVLWVSSGHNFKYCYMNLYLKREAIHSNYMEIKIEVSSWSLGMPGSHGSSSQKALIPCTVPVLRLPIREFGLGRDCCYSDLQRAFQEIRAAGVFRGILGHLGDPSSWEDGPVCPFRVRHLMFRTACLLYFLHMPHLMVNLNEVSVTGHSKHSAKVQNCHFYYKVTFLHIRTISDQKCSFSSVSQIH